MVLNQIWVSKEIFNLPDIRTCTGKGELQREVEDEASGKVSKRERMRGFGLLHDI